MRIQSLSGGLQLMFTPGALIPFLIGSLALAVMGNAAYQLLTNWLGTTNKAVAAIGVTMLLFVVGAAWLLSRLINKLRPVPPDIGKVKPEPRKGLILLVSTEHTSRTALAWHQEKLEHCWLFCSTQSAQTADVLKKELNARGKTAELSIINDVYDPLEYQSKVEMIYANLPPGFLESDIILDFTGMPACGSVGSVLACLNESRAIQYTPAQYDEKLKALQPLDPVEVVLHWGMLRPPATPNQSETHSKVRANLPRRETGTR